MSHRDYAIAQLETIEYALKGGQPLPAESRRYLLDVCERARRGEIDPLGMVRDKGDRSQPANQLAMAMAVHKHIKKGAAPAKAYEAVGREFNVEGTSDGAAAKAYRKHKAVLRAHDALHAARKSRLAVPRNVVDTLAKELELNSERNRRK